MKITIMGMGYVGLVTAACFAELNNIVTCVDIDKNKVNTVNSGGCHIYEPELNDLVKKHIRKNLSATTDAANCIKSSEIIFICVGTPSSSDGSTNLEYIKSAAKNIGAVIKQKTDYCVIAVKSTVPPGTTESLIPILEKESGKKCGVDFGIAMNPEFLPEGRAIQDFMNPDRTVIGAFDVKSYETLKKLYSGFKTPVLQTSLSTAEMIKYTSNAFLATKISFANEIGNICKELGLNVYEVMDAVGYDKRIGRQFLNAGIGYGGSCFKKDLNSLIYTAKKSGANPKVLQAVGEVNESQPFKILELAKKKIKSFNGKKVVILGLAFKPDSDDMREAPSISIVNMLLAEGAIVKVYDPFAMENARKIFRTKVQYATSLKDALLFGNTVFIITEWSEFKNEALYKDKVVFDGRKVLNKKSGDNYEGVCW